jgi:hypothetical protein
LGFRTTVALAVACFAAILTPASVCFVVPIPAVICRPGRFLRDLKERCTPPQKIGNYIPPASPVATYLS